MTALSIDLASLPTTKQINRMIGDIASSGLKLDQKIHLTALACLAHAAQYGDNRLFANLYDAMPKGSRRKALVFWAMNASPYFLFDKDGAVRFGVYKPEVKAYKPWDWDTLQAVPFYAVEGAQEALKGEVDKLKAQIAALTAGDINKFIAKLADRIEASLEGVEGKPPVANDDREKVIAKAAALRALVA